MFEAVILAGGFGTRLKSITGTLPKPMVDIGGEPFLFKLMRDLEAQGCSKIILSLHYGAQIILDQLSAKSVVKCSVDYVVEDTPLDTGGALKLAATKVKNPYFLAINGDTWTGLKISKFLENSLSRKADVTIAGIWVDDVSRYGSIEVHPDTGRLISIHEKRVSGPGVINSGTYLINKDSIFSYPAEKFSLEKEFFRAAEKKFYVYQYNGYFIDIGIPEDFNRACKDLV